MTESTLEWMERELGVLFFPLTATDSLQIATAYDIPRVGEPPQPSRVQAYVDITFYREGYYQFLTPTPINGHDAEEIVLKQPLVPWKDPLNVSGKAVILLPTFAQVTDWCPLFVVDTGG